MSPASSPAPAPRSFESVAVGDRLPALVEHVDIVTNFMFGVALWTAHRIHYDHVGAREDGLEAPVIPGALMSAYVARLLVDWCGNPTALEHLSSRNVASATIDTDITVSGTVTAKERADHHGRVTVAVHVTGDDHLLMECTARIRLPGLGPR